MSIRITISNMKTEFSQLLSTTEFKGRPELTAYAEDFMLEETRHGLKVQSIMLLVLLAATAFFGSSLGLSQSHAYTYGTLASLSLYIYFVSNKLNKINELHLIGMTLLII